MAEIIDLNGKKLGGASMAGADPELDMTSAILQHMITNGMLGALMLMLPKDAMEWIFNDVCSEMGLPTDVVQGGFSVAYDHAESVMSDEEKAKVKIKKIQFTKLLKELLENTKDEG